MDRALETNESMHGNLSAAYTQLLDLPLIRRGILHRALTLGHISHHTSSGKWLTGMHVPAAV